MATGKPPFSATGLTDLVTQICEAEQTPRVEGFSPAFNDLLARLLEKDPIKRIYWEHLRKHPFWQKEINQRSLPKQPQFESYLQGVRGVNPEDFAQQQEKNAYFIPNIHGGNYKKPKKVDPVRISQSVKKNIMKDQTTYQKGEDKLGDVNLVSKDQELNFSNKNEEEEDGDMKSDQ
mmetsp:Transcript_27646/g.26666  ORF Transcript_27646/g.26666 Transcript_27646/m.26666 type:complete len:176 (+) Transcript_27646:593-1120(+)